MITLLPPISPILVAPPAARPISLDEAKKHLRVDHSEEDGLIDTLINAVTGKLDGWRGDLGRCIMPQQWAITLDCWPVLNILLPFPECRDVSISYRDRASDVQTLDPDRFGPVMETPIGSILRRKTWSAFPDLDGQPGAIRVDFSAGFQEDDTRLATIKSAMLLMIGDLYRNRDTTSNAGTVSAIPMSTTVEALLAPFRRVSV